MCKQCVDAVELYFPGATNQERDFILWEQTAFPHAPGDYVANQVKEFAEGLPGDDKTARLREFLSTPLKDALTPTDPTQEDE